MKYQTKLLLSIFFLTLFVLCIINPILYYQSYKILVKRGGDHLKSLAATSAVVIDFKHLDKLQKPEDEYTPTYKRLQEELQKIIRLNRGEDETIIFAYVIRPIPNDIGLLECVIDADTSANHLHLGQRIPWDKQGDLIDNLKTPYTQGKFVKDRWGWFISGFAPILDHEGRYIATLGVDAYKGDILYDLSKVRRFMLIGSLIALGVSFVLGWLISKMVVSPIKLSVEKMYRLGHTYDVDEPQITNEVDFLEEMVEKMRTSFTDSRLLVANFSHVITEYHDAEIEKAKRDIDVTLVYFDLSHLAKLCCEAHSMQSQELVWRFLDSFGDMLSGFGGVIYSFDRDKCCLLFGVVPHDGVREEEARNYVDEVKSLIGRLNHHFASPTQDAFQVGIALLECSVTQGESHPYDLDVPDSLLKKARVAAKDSFEKGDSIDLGGT